MGRGGLQPSTVRGIAWTSGLASIALLVGGIALLYFDRAAVLPADLPSWDLEDVSDQIANIGVPVIGMVLAARRPRNSIGCTCGSPSTPSKGALHSKPGAPARPSPAYTNTAP